jgi:hypothetical protein
MVYRDTPVEQVRQQFEELKQTQPPEGVAPLPAPKVKRKLRIPAADK